ncbi:MAG: cupin domain-containing protein [Burkholderiales bacterium]|nr:cupin domain-containing protein [Burkholderiales bacterium]
MNDTYIRAGRINWIARGNDVGVQERTLAPGEEIPWHYHTVITDTTYCLEGIVQIEMLGPRERVLLAVGESHAVPTNRPHRITSRGGRPCRFVLVQGVGKYDRHPVDPEAWKG